LLFALGILVLAGGAFYTALVVATQIDRIFFPTNEIRLGGIFEKLPGVQQPSSDVVGGGRINILVMGMDRRPSEGSADTRTDTMFVMTIDPATRTARGLAMPRDLYVDIPSRTGNSTYKERINTAYAAGQYGGYPGGGPALVKQVVGNLLDIKVHYYVLVDLEGFKQIVDLLGGIDVDVPERLAVNDPFYSETERLGDYYPCVVPAGLHHLNGSQALCFSRVRRNSDDFARISRQQLVIFSIIDKATQLNVLANADSLWKRYKSTITTDVNDLQLPGFAKLAASIDPEQLAFLKLDAAVVPYTTPAGAAVLLPSTEGIRQIRDAFLADDRLLKEAATIEVQNGTGEQGHASRAKEFFESLGIPEAKLLAVNANSTSQTRTEIIDYTGKSYTARLLATSLSLPEDRIRKGTNADLALRHSEADIVVILGPDAKLENAVASPTTR
jgi:LCP family protein required for cell wall assembly